MLIDVFFEFNDVCGAGLLITFVFLCVTTACKPYCTEGLSNLNSLTMVAQFITLYGGLVLIVEDFIQQQLMAANQADTTGQESSIIYFLVYTCNGAVIVFPVLQMLFQTSPAKYAEDTLNTLKKCFSHEKKHQVVEQDKEKDEHCQTSALSNETGPHKDEPTLLLQQPQQQDEILERSVQYLPGSGSGSAVIILKDQEEERRSSISQKTASGKETWDAARTMGQNQDLSSHEPGKLLAAWAQLCWPFEEDRISGQSQLPLHQPAIGAATLTSDDEEVTGNDTDNKKDQLIESLEPESKELVEVSMAAKAPERIRETVWGVHGQLFQEIRPTW